VPVCNKMLQNHHPMMGSFNQEAIDLQVQCHCLINKAPKDQSLVENKASQQLSTLSTVNKEGKAQARLTQD